MPPAPAPVEQLVVEQASREFARFLGNYEFLRLMQGEASLGDDDAREVGAALDVEWRERWHRRCCSAPTSRPTPTSTPRPTCSRRSSGVCSSSTSVDRHHNRSTAASATSRASSAPRSGASARRASTPMSTTTAYAAQLSKRRIA